MSPAIFAEFPFCASSLVAWTEIRHGTLTRGKSPDSMPGAVVNCPFIPLLRARLMVDAQHVQSKRSDCTLHWIAIDTERGCRCGLDRDMSGQASRPGMPPTGPFEIEALEPGEYPDHPVPWSHDPARETSLAWNLIERNWLGRAETTEFKTCGTIPRQDCTSTGVFS